MNRRQKKKYLKNQYPIDMVRSCEYREICKTECDGCTYRITTIARKFFKKEKLSFSGWKFVEELGKNMFVFQCRKKGYKEFVLIYDTKKDTWLFYAQDKEKNLIQFENIQNILKSNYSI